MSVDLPDDCARLLKHQRGVIARWQAPAVGLSPAVIDGQLRRGRWQPLYRGVYAAYTGVPARESLLWAGLLRAGPGAVLSHHSAAELDGLSDSPAQVIHVTISKGRRLSITASEGGRPGPGDCCASKRPTRRRQAPGPDSAAHPDRGDRA